MCKRLKEKAIIIILLLIAGIMVGSKFQHSREKNKVSASFNRGHSVTSVGRKDFFDEGVDEKKSGKTS
jgi:hypothetical protein